MVKPILRSKPYRWSLPTCTGLKAAFHLRFLPVLVMACTSSTTVEVTGNMAHSWFTMRALASHRLRVEGGILFLRLRRLLEGFGRRHLREPPVRRLVRSSFPSGFI